jgi:hypothetical protein
MVVGARARGARTRGARTRGSAGPVTPSDKVLAVIGIVVVIVVLITATTLLVMELTNTL